MLGKSERPLIGPLHNTSSCRLDPDSIIDGFAESLLAAKISLSCLYRDVTQQKLDLFQFAAGEVAEPCAAPSKVMGRNLGETEFGGVVFHDVPDDFLCHSVAPDCSGSTNATE